VTLARLALGAPLASPTLSPHPTSTPVRAPDDVVTT
jgi:hypothetical protein